MLQGLDRGRRPPSPPAHLCLLWAWGGVLICEFHPALEGGEGDLHIQLVVAISLAGGLRLAFPNRPGSHGCIRRDGPRLNQQRVHWIGEDEFLQRLLDGSKPTSA